MKYGIKRKDGSPNPNWTMRVAFALAVVIVALWAGGRLDHTLYPLGMNKNECARNGYGAVFCGSELDRYRDDLSPTGIQTQ